MEPYQYTTTIEAACPLPQRAGSAGIQGSGSKSLSAAQRCRPALQKRQCCGHKWANASTASFTCSCIAVTVEMHPRRSCSPAVDVSETVGLAKARRCGCPRAGFCLINMKRRRLCLWSLRIFAAGARAHNRCKSSNEGIASGAVREDCSTDFITDF